jgi:hypothetical protein
MNRREFSLRLGSIVAVTGTRVMPTHIEEALLIPWICVTCGTQYPPSRIPLQICAICEDPRQYIGWEGQRWTTLDVLPHIYRNVIQEEEADLFSIHTEPVFGIGERAFLIQTPEGNILWDCVALLDEDTRKKIDALGGVQAIAISHPHYYTTMVEWSRAFDDAPIFLHELDRRWVMRPDANIQFWRGERTKLPGELTLIHTGGHFDGFQVLHWPKGCSGKGVLLAGDQPEVCSARNWVTFMYSYPNYIPLCATSIRAIVRALSPFAFDRLYGAFPGRTVTSDAKAVVERSAARYIHSISG